MKTIPLLLLSAFLFVGCATHPKGSSASQSTSDLVFVGTVTSITPDPRGRLVYGWVVDCWVDAVEQGRYSQNTFGFNVRSPSLSGLAVGKVYTVEADQSETGYVAKRWRKYTDDGE